jgi:hypothetical protein
MWVSFGHSAISAQCPDYSRKQTQAGHRGMSAKCHYQTCRAGEHNSVEGWANGGERVPRGPWPNLSRDRDFRLGGGKRSLLRSRQTIVSPEQSAQGTACHRFAIVAQVFFVHCFFIRLSRFRFHRDLRPY